MATKVHLKHRKWLISLSLPWERLEIRGEGSCATQDDSCSREGGNWFISVPLVPLPHHGPHSGATQKQIQAEAQPCWGDQSMFWPKNCPKMKWNFPTTREVWRACPAVRDLGSPAYLMQQRLRRNLFLGLSKQKSDTLKHLNQGYRGGKASKSGRWNTMDTTEIMSMREEGGFDFFRSNGDGKRMEKFSRKGRKMPSTSV